MRLIESLIPAGGLVLAGSMLIYGLIISDYDVAVMKFPIFVCALTIVFAGLVLFQQIRKAPDDNEMSAPGWSAFMLLLAVPLIALIGLELGFAIFFFAYLLFHGHGKIKSLLLAGCCFALSYVLFEYYFHISHFEFPML